jgi:hypothetical protein
MDEEENRESYAAFTQPGWLRSGAGNYEYSPWIECYPHTNAAMATGVAWLGVCGELQVAMQWTCSRLTGSYESSLRIECHAYKGPAKAMTVAWSGEGSVGALAHPHPRSCIHGTHNMDTEEEDECMDK